MTDSPESTAGTAGQGTTAQLLARVRRGDSSARDDLAARYLAVLRQWARGRVPPGTRTLADTDDLVQITLIKALKRVEEFEPRREGAFLAYLRTILRNQIVDQVRQAGRRPTAEELHADLAENRPSPLEEAIGKETLEAYERALDQLEPRQREALILRLELGWTHQEVADAIGSPSANAARMLVTRALTLMAELMEEMR